MILDIDYVYFTHFAVSGSI